MGWLVLMIYTLCDVDLLRDVPFRGGVVNAAHFMGQIPKKIILGAWIGIFKPNAINIKILLSELVHWILYNDLCGWSKRAQYKSKMADGRSVEKNFFLNRHMSAMVWPMPWNLAWWRKVTFWRRLGLKNSNFCESKMADGHYIENWKIVTSR